MLKILKSTIKNSFIYSFGNISTKIAGFILLPIYTKHLSVATYGMLSILEITSQIMIAFFGMALYQAFFRWYWDKQYIDKQKSIFFTSSVFSTLTAALMVIIIFIFSKPISQLLFDKPDYSYLLNLMAITSAIEIILQMPITLIRLQEKPGLFTITNILRLTVSLSLTVYFVAYANREIDGIYEATLIAQLTGILFLSKYLWKNIVINWESKILKDMLVFSFPLCLSGISAVLLAITDRYALNFLGGLSDVGIYSLGFKMANTINVFIVASINLAISPIIFRMMDDPNNKRFYSKTMTYYTFGLMFCVLGMSFFGKEIIKVLSSKPAYWDSYKVIPLISTAVLFGMLKDVSITGLQIVKKTKIIALIITLMAVLNLTLDIILIPYFHFIGAAIASLIAQCVYFIIVYKTSQRNYFIPYEINKVIKMLIVGCVLMFAASMFNDLHIILRLTLKTLLIVLFPVILYFWNFYEPVELISLKNFYLKWKDLKNWKNNFNNIKLG